LIIQEKRLEDLEIEKLKADFYGICTNGYRERKIGIPHTERQLTIAVYGISLYRCITNEKPHTN
jgi:hypothetical protein